MANPLETDPTLLALLDDAAQWLVMAACSSMAMGLSLPAGIAAMMPRLHTGYMPEAQRRAVAHRTYRDGLRHPGPHRSTRAAELRADARAFGLCT